jgi:nicotinamide mononucleotide transporter
MKKWLLNEFWIGYSKFEKIYLLLMIILQIVVFILVPDSPHNIIAGISGVISVVLCAKGKISFYFVGFIQTGIYLILSLESKFYGEVAENIFYLVTMIYGIFVWKCATNVSILDSLDAVFYRTEHVEKYGAGNYSDSFVFNWWNYDEKYSGHVFGSGIRYRTYLCYI